MKLSYDDVKRYIAHINLKKIGSFGQKKIIDTKVLIIGVGGLGSPVALYLASSGINNIGIVDHDKIDISNLHRQILFNEEDVNKFKVDIAEKRLKKINSKIKINKFKTKIDSNNINKIAKGYDLIIDGTDSFRSKLLINDYSYKNKKILICGAISKFDGHVFVFNFKKKNSPCLRCFMPEIPSTDMMDCQSEGVLSTLAGMIGTIMANEAIREILNFENSLCGNILIINAENLKKYLSIRTSVANLRIGPSPAHPIAFVYEKKNMPVEVIDEFEVWRKVKDYQGDIGWIHLSQLSRKRTLLTTKDGIVLFKNATIYSKPIIKIGNLEAAVIKKCIPNWCLVEIQKYKGWIQTDHVWGLENKEIIN